MVENEEVFLRESRRGGVVGVMGAVGGMGVVGGDESCGSSESFGSNGWE